MIDASCENNINTVAKECYLSENVYTLVLVNNAMTYHYLDNLKLFKMTFYQMYLSPMVQW